MKFCYVDETGLLNSDPCVVMAGIIVDAQRHQRTRDEFHGGLFDDAKDYFSPDRGEMKATRLFFGRGRWKAVPFEVRRELVLKLCGWVAERKHSVVLSAIEKGRLGSCTEIDDAWLGAGLHIALQNQRVHKQHGAKGRTVLIFDDNKQKMPQFCDLLWDPPEWTDDYYNRDAKKPALDLIIDSAFAVKSQHAGLVQVADLYAFVFRRHVELTDYAKSEEFAGERELLGECLGLIGPRVIKKGQRYPRGSTAGDLLASLAPASLLAVSGGLSR